MTDNNTCSNKASSSLNLSVTIGPKYTTNQAASSLEREPRRVAHQLSSFSDRLKTSVSVPGTSEKAKVSASSRMNHNNTSKALSYSSSTDPPPAAAATATQARSGKTRPNSHDGAPPWKKGVPITRALHGSRFYTSYTSSSSALRSKKRRTQLSQELDSRLKAGGFVRNAENNTNTDENDNSDMNNIKNVRFGLSGGYQQDDDGGDSSEGSGTVSTLSEGRCGEVSSSDMRNNNEIAVMRKRAKSSSNRNVTESEFSSSWSGGDGAGSGSGEGSGSTGGAVSQHEGTGCISSEANNGSARTETAVSRPRTSDHTKTNSNSRKKRKSKEINDFLATPEGQLAKNPSLSHDQAVFRAKREYNRLNALKARKRAKSQLETLQSSAYRLGLQVLELKNMNEKLEKKRRDLQEENDSIVRRQKGIDGSGVEDHQRVLALDSVPQEKPVVIPRNSMNQLLASLQHTMKKQSDGGNAGFNEQTSVAKEGYAQVNGGTCGIHTDTHQLIPTIEHSKRTYAAADNTNAVRHVNTTKNCRQPTAPGSHTSYNWSLETALAQAPNKVCNLEDLQRLVRNEHSSHAIVTESTKTSLQQFLGTLSDENIALLQRSIDIPGERRAGVPRPVETAPLLSQSAGNSAMQAQNRALEQLLTLLAPYSAATPDREPLPVPVSLPVAAQHETEVLKQLANMLENSECKKSIAVNTTTTPLKMVTDRVLGELAKRCASVAPSAPRHATAPPAFDFRVQQQARYAPPYQQQKFQQAPSQSLNSPSLDGILALFRALQK